MPRRLPVQGWVTTAQRRALLERFDFRSHDVDHTRRVVDEFDDEIAVLSRERYSLTYNRKKIRAAINEGRVVFEAHDAERLFREAGVLVWMPNERYLDQQASGCSMPVCGSSTWAAAPPSKPASGHPAEQCLLSRHKLGEVSADVRRS
jgi:hypothetical protein